MHIHLNIAMTCNYRCSYCITKDKSYCDFSDSELDLVIGLVNSMSAERVSICGPKEPSLMPNLSQIIARITHPVFVVTNFHRSCDYYNSLNAVICPSFHPEYMDAQTYVDKCNQLHNCCPRPFESDIPPGLLSKLKSKPMIQKRISLDHNQPTRWCNIAYDHLVVRPDRTVAHCSTHSESVPLATYSYKPLPIKCTSTCTWNIPNYPSLLDAVKALTP